MVRKNTCVVWEYDALGRGWSWRLTGMPLVCLDAHEGGERRQRLWNPMSCEKPWTDESRPCGFGQGQLSQGAVRRSTLRKRRRKPRRPAHVKMQINKGEGPLRGDEPED